MDLNAFQKSIYGDVENDAELLAELEMLQGKPKKSSKKPQIPAKQLTPEMLQAALKDEEFDDFNDEDLENDSELQDELADLMDDVSVNDEPIPPKQPVVQKTHSVAPKRAASPPPSIPPRGEPPSPPKKMSEVAPPPPPLPERTTSNQEMPQPLKPSESKPIKETIPQNDDISEAEKVRRELAKRFEAYTVNLKLAKEANDLPNAKEFAAKVEMFEQAIQVANANDLTMADLEDVPEMPPIYKPKKPQIQPKTLLEDLEMRYSKLFELSENYKKEGQDMKARMQIRLSGQFKDAINAMKKGKRVDISALPLVPGLAKLVDMPYAKEYMAGAAAPIPKVTPATVPGPTQPKPGPSTSVTPSPQKPKAVSTHQKPEDIKGDTTEKNQLRFLLTRQQQFKEAALQAKKKGDLSTAKEMLVNAKKMEPMIQASEGGLPVDISKIPLPPQSGVSKGLMRQFSLGADNQLQDVERVLIRQLELCDQNRKQFNERNDSKSVMIYEKLMTGTKMDLLHFRELLKIGQRPVVKAVTLTLPALKEATEKGIADDQMEVKIINIEGLKLQDGYKLHHLSIYIKCIFSFPHESHQTLKTQTINGTDNPEFDEVLHFKINRKIRQFYRSIGRIPLKFEIYQKGSFLRSDKLWYTVEVPLSALTKQTLITSCSDIMENRRRPTGGKLTAQIRVARILNDADAGVSGATSRKTAPTITQKWIKVER